MNTLENPLTFVRSIKGAPASILWALLFTQRLMTNQELQRWTGYASDAVTNATRLLVDLGWLIPRSNYGPWSLAPGRQLPLMSEPAPPLPPRALSLRALSPRALSPSSVLIGTPPSSSSITEATAAIESLQEQERTDPEF